ncbi:disease resistance protein RGA5-like isoform X1 [Miscanthus floridulus]|uniref:disease resistance protein RGA5-like isoform X1 n=1 Tax=Miscanthus floridulus TaxID=154761 RepID=UPI0034591C74
MCSWCGKSFVNPTDPTGDLVEQQQQQQSDIKNFLSTTLTSSGTKEMMNEILHFCYDSLRQHLKTCLLYLSMYPEGYIISKAALIRRWIAEGFICTASEEDTEEIADSYFNDLISRRLIHPNRVKHIDGVISCTVHHMVLDMIKCKSKETNFTTVTDYPHITAGLSIKVRRLSLLLCSAKHAPRAATVAMPQVRSLAFFGLLECLPLVASCKFKLIRVLVLEIWGEHNGCTSLDFTRLCTLLHLRYVNITSDITVQLPDKMVGLQHLETFQVDARVSSVPLDIIDLPRLSHLRIKDEIELPDGVGSIRSLHTLQYFDLAHNSEDNVQSLGGLSNLQNLHLTCSKAGSEEHLKRNLDALSTSVGKLDDLCSLTLAPGALGAARIPLEGSIIVSCVPECIKRLEMSPQICIFSRLPECMGRLRKLRVLKISVRELLRNDIDRLSELPALVVLTLHVRVARVGVVVIQSASFPALRYFKYRSSVLSMVFRAGAMPNLDCLKLGFHAQREKQYGRMLGGVEHLRHLKEITGEITIANGASESDRRAAESAFHNTIELSSQKWYAVSGHPRFPSVRVKLADSWVVPEEEGYEGGVTGMATTDRDLVCENLPFPLDVLPFVISFTSPVDACRSSAVCTAFHAVASSDQVWDRFIPADYRSMLSRAVDPIDLGFASTKKELFTTLAEQHIFIDDGNKSFWLDRTTGAKSYMLASKSLAITWGGTPQYWRRTASRDSRFVDCNIKTRRFEEVAELIDVCWLDIIATIDCRELSLNTTYTAYLVFGLNDRSFGLDSETQEACITIAGEVSARHTISLHARARSQRRLGSSSRYWLQRHQWENEEDSKNEDNEEVEEEEEDDHLWVEDKEDDKNEDSEEEDDSDIDVEEDENEDDGEKDEEEEEDDDDMEVEEDKDIDNEENETEEEEKYNIELEETGDAEEEESDDELEEQENDFQHFDLPINTAHRMQGTPPDIGGSSDLSDSLEDEQEEGAVRYPRARGDGWMEVTLGDFYNGNLDDGTIEIRLMEHRSLNWKSGLIVEGVEIRPKLECDKQAATS